MKFSKVSIPKLPRNRYDYVAPGNATGTTIIYNNGNSSDLGDDMDTTVFAHRDEDNSFTRDNTFKGKFIIDNVLPAVVLKRNSVQVAALGYDVSKSCVSLSSTEANKGLNLYDDGRFEFGEHAVYHAGNSNLNTVDWTARTLFSNVLKAANQAELVKFDGTDTVLGALTGTTTIQSKAADLLHSKGGANHIIWDASNSNLNTVDWKAKSIFAKDHVQNENFISGYTGTGCRISADGKAECTDLWVRGTMNVYELIVNKINATNGALAVSDSGKVASVSGYTLTLTGDNDNMNTFRVGDVLKCQRFTGKNVKLYFLTVTAITGLNVTFTYRSGGSGANTVAAGDVLVRWNSSDANRKGLLYLTASDSQAPYMDVLYNEQVRLRLGRLDGIADSAFPTGTQPNGFGLYAQNSFLKGVFVLTSGKTVDGEITAVNNKANTAQTAASNAQTAANNANNAITSIRTELSAVDGKITLAVNETKTYTNNAINNLQIGNRNFSRYTASLKTYTLSTGAGSLGYPTTGLKKGDVITVSFEIDINIPSWTSGTKMLQFDQNYAYMSFYNFPSGDNKKGWLKRTAQLTIGNTWNTTNPTTEGMTSNPYMRMDNLSTELANGGYVKVRNFKVEKGNKATDWTPAPEDVAQDAQDKANAALNAAKTYTNSEISVVNGKINLKVDSSTFNALGNRVSSCESRITQTENSIKLKADQTTVNGINSRLQSAEAKITPDAIRLTVKDQTTTIANQQSEINARRQFLVPDSEFGTAYTGSLYSNITQIAKASAPSGCPTAYCGRSQTRDAVAQAYVPLVEGDKIYIEAYVNTSQANGTCAVGINFINDANGNTWVTAASLAKGSGWTKISGTITVPNGYTKGRLWLQIGLTSGYGSYYFTKIKASDSRGAMIYTDTLRNDIKSQFTMDSSGISMLGKKIAFTGVVTFNALAGDAQNKINAAQNTANTARTEKIELARLGTTVISGGYIKTGLINTDELVAKKVTAATGTFNSLSTTGGTMTLDGAGVTFAQNSAGIIAGLGINSGTIAPSTGLSVPIGSVRTATNQYSTGNMAAYFSARNARGGDSGGYYGNCAILMGYGSIYGFKLKLRRINTTTTLDSTDVMIITTASNDINITMPNMGSTEQERINNDGRFIMIGKRGSGNIYVYCGRRYEGWRGFTTGNLKIDNTNHWTFVYDGVNNAWDCFHWGD